MKPKIVSFRVQVFAQKNLWPHAKTVAKFGQNAFPGWYRLGEKWCIILHRRVSCNHFPRVVYFLAKSLMSTVNLLSRRHSQGISSAICDLPDFCCSSSPEAYAWHPYNKSWGQESISTIIREPKETWSNSLKGVAPMKDPIL